VGLLNKLAINGFMLFVLLTGAFASACAFHDPDICWLLGTGRVIVDNMALPAADPFSWTIAEFGSGQPFVVYQWLTEVVFYWVYRTARETGLAVFTAVVLNLAFVTLPLLFLSKKLTLSSTFSLIFLGVLASGFHYFARPEIFSYVIFALWIPLVRSFDKEIEVPPCSGLIALSVLWANMHSGFVVGILYLLLYSILSGKAKLLILSTICATATLINPYGLQLWQYLPGLFFSTANQVNLELQPLAIPDMFAIQHIGFVAMLALAFKYLYTRISKNNTDSSTTFSATIILVSAIMGIMSKRMILFAVIMLLFEMRYLMGTTGDATAEESKEKSHWKLACTSVILAAIGAFQATITIATPYIPQPSIVFNVPWDGLKKLTELPQNSRMLNDARFGDATIWLLSAKPKVFIDTRYDVYGTQLFQDHLTMINASPGYDELFAKYKVDTVFVPPDAPIVQPLLETKSWKVFYKDDSCVILVRQ
jgi:hypothetical protein